MATVTALIHYPIKACAGITVERAVLTERGMAHDRSFMVVGPDGTFLSQRSVARLAVVRPEVLHEGSKLALSAPTAPDLTVDIVTGGPARPVTVHSWRGFALDQGEEAAEWFSAVLGRPARLVRVTPDHDRDGKGEERGKINFADSTALTVVSVASLDSLNTRLVERGADALPMSRFRPNIVVTGWAEPHTEDRVRRMSIGTAEIGYGERNIRCVVTTVDQLVGERAGPEPLRTLASYRREEDGVSFGLKAAVLRTGQLTLGDEVTVDEWL